HFILILGVLRLLPTVLLRGIEQVEHVQRTGSRIRIVLVPIGVEHRLKDELAFIGIDGLLFATAQFRLTIVRQQQARRQQALSSVLGLQTLLGIIERLGALRDDLGVLVEFRAILVHG